MLLTHQPVHRCWSAYVHIHIHTHTYIWEEERESSESVKNSFSGHYETSFRTTHFPFNYRLSCPIVTGSSVLWFMLLMSPTERQAGGFPKLKSAACSGEHICPVRGSPPSPSKWGVSGRYVPDITQKYSYQQESRVPTGGRKAGQQRQTEWIWIRGRKLQDTPFSKIRIWRWHFRAPSMTPPSFIPLTRAVSRGEQILCEA